MAIDRLVYRPQEAADVMEEVEVSIIMTRKEFESMIRILKDVSSVEANYWTGGALLLLAEKLQEGLDLA